MPFGFGGGSDLGDATLRLKTDDSQFDQGINRAHGSASNLVASFTRAGGAIAAALVGGAAALSVSAISAASDVEEMQSKFDTVFRDLSDEVRDWADETADATGRSTFAMQGWLAQLQDTFVPMGFARDTAASMSTQLTELAIDLASFNNLNTEDVINRLTSAMVGNSEAVRSLGIDLSAAALAQEGITNESTRQEKALASLNVILKSTTDAQGDAVRTADSFANQMVALRSELEELQIELGQNLLPIATQFLVWLRSDGIPILTKLVENFVNMLPIYQEWIGALGDAWDWYLKLADAITPFSDLTTETKDEMLKLNHELGATVDILKNDYGIAVRQHAGESTQEYLDRITALLGEQISLNGVIQDTVDVVEDDLVPAFEKVTEVAEEAGFAFQALVDQHWFRTLEEEARAADGVYNDLLITLGEELQAIPPPPPFFDQEFRQVSVDNLDAVEAAATAKALAAANAMIAETERVAEEEKRINTEREREYDRLHSDIKDAFGDTFLAMIEDGEVKFDRLGEYFKNVFSTVALEEVLGGIAADFITPFVDMARGAIRSVFSSITGGLAERLFGSVGGDVASGTAGIAGGGASTAGQVFGGAASFGTSIISGAVGGLVSGLVGLFQSNKQVAIEENTRRTHIILTDMMNDRLQPMREDINWNRHNTSNHLDLAYRWDSTTFPNMTRAIETVDETLTSGINALIDALRVEDQRVEFQILLNGGEIARGLTDLVRSGQVQLIASGVV